MREKRAKDNESATVAPPLNWPLWDSLASAQSRKSPDMSFEALSAAAKLAYQSFSAQNDAASLTQAMRTFDAALRHYQSAKMDSLLALLSHFDAKENQKAFETYLLEEAELESLMNAVYKPLLEKENLTELADFWGINLFLRLQNRQVLYKTELTELLQTEKLLLAQGPKPYGLAQMIQTAMKDISGTVDSESSSIHDVYLKLFALRRQLANELKLPNFSELAFLRTERFDYQIEEIQATSDLIKRFLVPLAVSIRQALANDAEQNQAWQFYCWERFIPRNRKTPQLDEASIDLSFLSSFLNRLLKGSAPNFLSHLSEKGYVQLDLIGEQNWVDCVLLPDLDLPQILGRMDLTAESLPELLCALGVAFAYLCTYQDGDFFVMREPSFELRQIWAHGLLFLALEHFPRLFEKEEDGEAYRQIILEQTVQRLCFQAMLFEFEMECVRMPKVDREAMERSWMRLIRSYFPDLAEDSAWLRMQRGAYMYLAQLWQNPFGSIGELQANLIGLQLWDQGRKSRSLSLNAYETLCTLGSSDQIPRLLEQSRLQSPWGEASIKRLAYQLAYQLGY